MDNNSSVTLSIIKDSIINGSIDWFYIQLYGLIIILSTYLLVNACLNDKASLSECDLIYSTADILQHTSSISQCIKYSRKTQRYFNNNTYW
ncbi:hypothetical protein RhiirA1_476758 [Rhizophagus irregularis]|uniref:Uncharacterized protein n=1 Tax=Rhizophagus irregularis TaxID=588596 RepID=A0A2N0QUJ7_9GLOM|nr:hypothetical protein RhiirA1_476758 [Rhizophagus irregularis]